MRTSILRTAPAAALTVAVSSSAFAQLTPPDGKSMGGGDCAANKFNCKDTPNPLPKTDTVWLEKMTWMDVRDAMAAGKKTIIVPSGGTDPFGPAFFHLAPVNVELAAANNAENPRAASVRVRAAERIGVAA